jgi:fermentation-respiration switch protein FrsA (DUF1100 family)
MKEMLGLPDVAECFQRAGITALIYDPRCSGLSGGSPRNDIGPVKQAEDYSDALTFLNGLPEVDPNCMGFWGMSFAGTVSLCFASLDRRAMFVIAICPLAEFRHIPQRLPSVLAKCIKDRESKLRDNSPYYLSMLTETGENPAGFGIGVDKEHFAKVVTAGKELAPSHVNRTTIQSYYKMLMWQPFSLWTPLNPTPVLFVVPENDQRSRAAVQLRRFEALEGPRRFHTERGRGHKDILEGEHFPALMQLQSSFVDDALHGKVARF